MKFAEGLMDQFSQISGVVRCASDCHTGQRTPEGGDECDVAVRHLSTFSDGPSRANVLCYSRPNKSKLRLGRCRGIHSCCEPRESPDRLSDTLDHRSQDKFSLARAIRRSECSSCSLQANRDSQRFLTAADGGATRGAPRTSEQREARLQHRRPAGCRSSSLRQDTCGRTTWIRQALGVATRRKEAVPWG